MDRIDKEDIWREDIERELATLTSGQECLRDDVQTVKEDVSTLKDDVKKLKLGQERLEERLKRNEDTLAFMVKTMDRYQAENKRYFEVLIEQNRSGRGVQGEGIRANRERLDEHEIRIRDLEVS